MLRLPSTPQPNRPSIPYPTSSTSPPRLLHPYTLASTNLHHLYPRFSTHPINLIYFYLYTSLSTNVSNLSTHQNKTSLLHRSIYLQSPLLHRLLEPPMHSPGFFSADFSTYALTRFLHLPHAFSTSPHHLHPSTQSFLHPSFLYPSFHSTLVSFHPPLYHSFIFPSTFLPSVHLVTIASTLLPSTCHSPFKLHHLLPCLLHPLPFFHPPPIKPSSTFPPSPYL